MSPRHCSMVPSPPATKSTDGAPSDPNRRAASRHESGSVTRTGSTRGRTDEVSAMLTLAPM